MSAIEAALRALKAKKRGPQCSVGALLDELQETDPAGHQALIEILENRDITAPVIANALAQLGYKVHRDTIVRHRRRAKGSGCSCAS